MFLCLPSDLPPSLPPSPRSLPLIMFKKTPAIKPLAPLRSSDRRKLADQIITDFALKAPTTEVADHEQTPDAKAEATAAHSQLRNSLLPENTQSARFTTTQGPDLKQAGGNVYVGSHNGGEGRVLWFQVDGRLYPTCYTLWRHPDIVPLLHTPDIVIQKLKGGADLMTPGLAGGPPFPEKAKKGATVAVASTDKPSVPVMVGWCEVDVAALKEVRGARGHAVKNLHWMGDEVWGFGTTGKAGRAAPESIEGWERVLERRGLAEKVGSLGLDDEDEAGGVAVGEDDGVINGTVLANHNPHVEGEDAISADAGPAKELSQKDIDSVFRNAFLYSIHKAKTERGNSAPNYGFAFPLTQSFIMSTMIQPFLPAFTPEDEKQLQIRKTSWKNVKKFVKSLDKEQIIKSKEKDGHETVILDIDFNDRAIQEFQPYKLPRKETTGGAAQGRGEQATTQIDSGDPSVGQKLEIKTLYKPTSKLLPLFANSDKQFLIPTEVREIVTAYIESADLISETNKRLVKLDPTLANAVFDGSGNLDKEVLAKGTVPRDALVDRVLGAMSTAYTIQNTSLPAAGDNAQVKPKSGLPPKVKITLETRSGNKTVTKVSGLETYFISPRLLADELRKVCAGSTSVEPLAGAAKKNEKPVEEVMVQGPQRDAVVKALEKRGMDKRWVEVVDKTKGKGKGR